MDASIHECLGKNVAVKKVNAEILTDPSNPDAGRDVRRAVKREINVLGSFRNNPNLIRLIGYYIPTPADAGEGPEEPLDHICLVYEYAENGDLFNFLQQQQLQGESVVWQTRLRIAVGIAKGLSYLHAHNAYHRDMKSSNIVIQHAQTPKIIDCGLSKYVPDNDGGGGASGAVSVFTTTGMKFGTPEYMCPEYLRSRTMPYDALCDIYSFGIVLLELLTGLKQAKDEKYLQDEVDDIAADANADVWPPGCVDEFRELCGECVERRSKRIKSMTAVMRRLIEISRKYDQPTAMESNLLRENELLRQQVEDMRVERDVNARIRESEEEKACDVCCDIFKLSKGVECNGRNGNHFLCAGCLSDMVKSQSTHVQDFINNGCAIVCALCEGAHIDQRVSAVIDDSMVCRMVGDDVAITAFIKVQRDATASLQEKIAEGRLERERQRARDQLLEETAKIITNQAEKKQRSIERHMLRIREDILNTHCPHCDIVFSDWDACMAVQHLCEDANGRQFGCMRYFCGWCLERCASNSQCHEHVKRCPLNKNPGSYYGSWAQFLQTQASVRAQKINQYLNVHIDRAVDNDNGGLTRDELISAIRETDLTPLGINM